MSRVSTQAPNRGQIASFEAPPLPTLADLIAANRCVASFAEAQDRARSLPDLPKPHALTATTAEKWRQVALGQRRKLLSTMAADEAADAVRAVVWEPQHADVTSMLVAQLLDCFPPDKLGNPRTFFEALVFDLGDAGFSDATIAAACLDLRRTSKFRPSIAEVLDRCRAKHRYAAGVHAGSTRYSERLRAVHLILHHTGGDPDPVEVEAFAPCPDEPLLVAEYAKGAANEWWYDLDLNPALLLQQTGSGEETDEEWRFRFLRMKELAEADPAGTVLRIERDRGARVGREIAAEYHRRSELGRRRDACARIERIGLTRFPEREPAALFTAWLCGADSAFVAHFDKLEPDYDAEEIVRQERHAREVAQREAHRQRYRTPQAGGARR